MKTTNVSTVNSGLHKSGTRIDVVHSPDDGGYYGQRWSDDAVTDVYANRCDLEAALAKGTVNWSDGDSGHA